MNQRLQAAGGTLLLLAGTAILMAVITAEALYPAEYRTDRNTISDLGGSRPPESLVLQPSAAIFDVTMVVTGLMIIAAAILIGRGTPHRAVAVTTGLLGAGCLGVGIFNGTTTPHPLLALLAFVSGGLAAVLSARGVSGPLRIVLAAFGVVALVSLAAGLFLLEWTPVSALGEGGTERWIVYPVVLWMVAFGAYLTKPGTESARR